jgi:CheY-like chemotaxis protein
MAALTRDPVPRGTETVLLVEPEPESRTLGAFMLSRLGYTVLEARNATEAFSVYENCGCRVDLLVAEVRMPRVSGQELVQALTARDSDLRVLYLADTDFARRLRRTAHRGQAILERPFTRATLAQGVRQALGAAVRPRVLTAGTPF